MDRLAREFPTIVSDLVDIASAMPPKTVVIAGGDREGDLRLVEAARDHGLIKRVLLVGDPAKIRAAAEVCRIPLQEADLIPSSSEEETADHVVKLVQGKQVDVVLKGSISTPVLNRAILRLRTRRTVSLVTLFDAPPIGGGRLMILTDAGVTTVCDKDRMMDLIENAVEVARVVMGLSCPRVALLSANEKQIPSLPSTTLAAELMAHPWEHARVYGPLSLDLAIDPESVRDKGLEDLAQTTNVAGHADILVCPGIDTANVFYKLVMECCKYGLASIASMTVGIEVPYIILSRADLVETKLDSIALSCVYAERTRARSASEEPVQIQPPTPPRPHTLPRSLTPPRPHTLPRLFTLPRLLKLPSLSEEVSMSGARQERWLFRIHVIDRAGALTSIASAFSSRGISLDTVIGHGAEHTPTHDGTVVVSFRCTEEDKNAMRRIIERQAKVLSVEEHPYDSQLLRKSALVRTSRALVPRDVAGEQAFLIFEPLGQDHEGWKYFLAGPPSDLDPVIDRLIAEGVLVDSVYGVSAL